MLSVVLAFRYLVVATFLGVFFVFWLSTRKWRKYRPGDKELKTTPYLQILTFSLAALVAYAWLDKIEGTMGEPLAFWTKAIIAGFAWPFVFLFMVMAYELSDWFNKREGLGDD